MALPPGPWLPGDHGHWCNLSALCVGGVAVWPGARVGGRTAALLALSWVLLCKQTAVTHPVGLSWAITWRSTQGHCNRGGRGWSRCADRGVPLQSGQGYPGRQEDR